MRSATCQKCRVDDTEPPKKKILVSKVCFHQRSLGTKEVNEEVHSPRCFVIDLTLQITINNIHRFVSISSGETRRKIHDTLGRAYGYDGKPRKVR